MRNDSSRRSWGCPCAHIGGAVDRRHRAEDRVAVSLCSVQHEAAGSPRSSDRVAAERPSDECLTRLPDCSARRHADARARPLNARALVGRLDTRARRAPLAPPRSCRCPRHRRDARRTRLAAVHLRRPMNHRGSGVDTLARRGPSSRARARARRFVLGCGDVMMAGVRQEISPASKARRSPAAIQLWWHARNALHLAAEMSRRSRCSRRAARTRDWERLRTKTCRRAGRAPPVDCLCAARDAGSGRARAQPRHDRVGGAHHAWSGEKLESTTQARLAVSARTGCIDEE